MRCANQLAECTGIGRSRRAFVSQGCRSRMPRWSLAPLVLCAALFVSSHAALADLLQQGSKLIGTGAVGVARQGTSAALSADGNTAIVGGPLDNGQVGAAWV